MFATKLAKDNIEYEITKSPVRQLKKSIRNLASTAAGDAAAATDAMVMMIDNDNDNERYGAHISRINLDFHGKNDWSSSDEDDDDDDKENDTIDAVNNKRRERERQERERHSPRLRKKKRIVENRESRTSNNSNVSNNNDYNAEDGSDKVGVGVLLGDNNNKNNDNNTINNNRGTSTSSGNDGAKHSSYMVDWRKLGRHKRYADLTMQRPLMRGWLHFLCVSIGYPVLIYNANNPNFVVRHPRTFWLMICTLVPYTMSTLLHFVPWKSRRAHDIALSGDFLGISFGFTSHTVLFTENLIHGVEARVAIFATMTLFIMQVLAFRQKQTCVMKYMRRERFLIFALNIVLLMIVETKYIHGVSWKTNVIIQFLSKFLSPFYFVYCTRMDCKRKSPMTIPGLWCAHENWHLMIFLNHLTQLYAMLRLVGDYCPINRECSDLLASW